MQPTLIVITGHPGSGKTSIARQLAVKNHLLYLTKDAFKERIFDGLGSSDKDWSLKVSGVAHRIMDDIIEQELANGHSVIVESNFKPEIDSERFSKLAQKYRATTLQILCQASTDELFKRWQERIAKGQRHEGHVEAISLEQIRRDREVPYPPLVLPGKTITIDTTDFATVAIPDLNEILAE